jgi:tRNA pseudouridine38-40 synthase
MSLDGLRQVMARWLPSDLWLVEASEAAPDFNARHAARRRWYRYAIWRSAVAPAQWQGRCLIQRDPLDVAAMRAGARALLGRHDFVSLATRPTAGQSTVRTVFAADWLERDAQLLIFEICADAFLKQMVRAIVGSLIWVGTAHWPAEQFATSITSADRRAAGPNAPSAGLTLHRIEY